MMADVRVVGMVRGREIARPARISVEEQALVLSWHHAAPWQLAFDGLEGVQIGATSVTLYLRDHDVLELTGDDALRPVALRVLDKACRMPELTRGLRHLGAVRGSAVLQAAHDRWFAPLLAARRAVADVSDPSRQIALMNAVALAEAMTRTIGELAATAAPGDAAERRALEAALEDEAEALFAALTRARLAGDAVTGGAEDTRLADWRRWVEAMRAVFAEADEAWLGVQDTLSA
jgi:hypothetical protein